MGTQSIVALSRCIGMAIYLCGQLHLSLWKLKRQLRQIRNQLKIDLADYPLGKMSHFALLRADKKLLTLACRHHNITQVVSERARLKRLLSVLRNVPSSDYIILTSAGQAVARGAIAALAKQLNLVGLSFVQLLDEQAANSLKLQLINFIDLQLCIGSRPIQASDEAKQLNSERIHSAASFDLQMLQSEYEFQSLRFFALPQAILSSLALGGNPI